MAHDVEAHHAGTEVPIDLATAENSFPPFDPSHFTSELIWLAITFGALYMLMSRVALPRVANLIDLPMQIMESEVRRGWRDPELVPLFQQCVSKIEGQRRDSEPADWSKSNVFQQSLDNMRRELLK